MVSLMAAAGEVLAITVLAMGIAGFLQFYARTRYRPHLAMLPAVVLVVGSSLLLFSIYDDGDHTRAALFLLVQSIAMPFFIYWGEQNRTRMERIAATGEFDPGFPLPSTSFITIGFYGQIFEDLAKPVVALEGERQLNALVQNLAIQHPVLRSARFTPQGEFKLDQEALIRLGESKIDANALTSLLDGLIMHLAKTGNIADDSELTKVIRTKCSKTVSDYLDFLIEEGIYHNLAGGRLANKVSTGRKDFDKMLEGGLQEGVAALVLMGSSREREEMGRAFLTAGLSQGDGCLVVSATRSPQEIRRGLDLAQAPVELRFVDCYTSRLREVPVLEEREDIIVSPVDLSVVNVAVSRSLESMRSPKKRALVDVLSAYMMTSPVDKVCPSILDMIHLLRRNKCTALFVFNPSAVEDESTRFVLQELFDCVVRANSGGDPAGTMLNLEKVGYQPGQPDDAADAAEPIGEVTV